MKDLLALLPRLVGRRVLVVGDVCLDEYIVGRARRLSREAPVPVLEFLRRFTVPGAAANPALNIRALGGQAYMVGVVGDDEAGQALRVSLSQEGIETQGVLVDASRQTTVKTRVLAEVSLHFPQQMVRVDRQERRELDDSIRAKLLAHLENMVPQVDAVLLSDYRSGVIEPGLISQVVALVQRHGRIATVDSQGDLFQFQHFTVVKCNREEAENALRCSLGNEDEFQQGAQRLLERLMSQAVVITRGSDGMSLADRSGDCLHIPAANRSEVFDVTGAGDTVIATLTQALAAGSSFSQAAHLANYAAGLVVKKLGNATATPGELAEAIRRGNAEGGRYPMPPNRMAGGTS